MHLRVDSESEQMREFVFAETAISTASLMANISAERIENGGVGSNE